MATETSSFLLTNHPPIISPFLPIATCKSLVSISPCEIVRWAPREFALKKVTLTEGHKYEKKNQCKYSNAKMGHRVAIPKGSMEYDAGKGRGLAHDRNQWSTCGRLKEVITIYIMTDNCFQFFSLFASTRIKAQVSEPTTLQQWPWASVVNR